MSLTDPELDLLLEMLEDDPADSSFVQVGEELVRRTRWSEAGRVLARGVEAAGGPPEGHARCLDLLARANLELGRYEDAIGALRLLPRDPRTEPERARVEILALERSGRFDEARDCALRFLESDGTDVVVTSVIERLAAPPPSPRYRGADPFYTVERAERYVAVGRADRAVRVYRKILLANQGNPSIALRMRQLMTAPADVEDDLSAELTDPGMVPEQPEEVVPLAPIHMPIPSMSTPPAVERDLAPAVERDLAPAVERDLAPAVERGPAPAFERDLAPADLVRDLAPVDLVRDIGPDTAVEVAPTDPAAPDRALAPTDPFAPVRDLVPPISSSPPRARPTKAPRAVPAAPPPLPPRAPDQATMELPPLRDELDDPDGDEDATQRIDVMALLKQYASSPGYEEEDTILDLTVVRDDDVPRRGEPSSPPQNPSPPTRPADPSDAPLPGVDPRKTRTVRR